MVYLVRAIYVDGVTGTVTAKKNTRPEAFELAKSLRAAGLWVIVTGPEGSGIDEQQGACIADVTSAAPVPVGPAG
jgi:hypothetical protein